jgi:hypothetical protein
VTKRRAVNAVSLVDSELASRSRRHSRAWKVPSQVLWQAASHKNKQVAVVVREEGDVVTFEQPARLAEAHQDREIQIEPDSDEAQLVTWWEAAQKANRASNAFANLASPAPPDPKQPPSASRASRSKAAADLAARRAADVEALCASHITQRQRTCMAAHLRAWRAAGAVARLVDNAYVLNRLSRGLERKAAAHVINIFFTRWADRVDATIEAQKLQTSSAESSSKESSPLKPSKVSEELCAALEDAGTASRASAISSWASTPRSCSRAAPSQR